MCHKRSIFLILVIVMFNTLSGCKIDNDEDTLGYDDFEHLDHWDDLKNLTAEKTIIYYYSPFCDICIQLEEPVTKLLLQLDPHRDVLLADDGYLYGAGEPDFELFGVPALIILEAGEFIELIRGSAPVLEYLNNEIDNLEKD